MPAIFATSDSLLNDKKTHELIIFIASKMNTCDGYGAVMLNKALYYVDSISYLKHKQPISSFKYVKQNLGPTPLPSQFLPVREALLEQHELEEVRQEYFGRIKKKLVAKRNPDLSLFSKEEISLIDSVVAALSVHSATSVSELSHKEMSWNIAETMEPLPLYSYLLSSQFPSNSDIEWAQEEIKRIESQS